MDVTVLCPGATHTEFGQVAGSTGGGFAMEADPVVRAAIGALGRRWVVVPGVANKAVTWLDRIFPRAFVTRMSARTLKRQTLPERR